MGSPGGSVKMSELRESLAKNCSEAWSLAHWTANVTLHPGPVTWKVQLLHPEQFPVHFEGRPGIQG